MQTTVHAIRRWGVVLTLVAAAAVAMAAQDSAQQPVFRSGVDAVTVDVTVLDKDGKPVRDLTAADFEVREGGKLQTVTAFRLIETDDGLDDSRAQREILSFDEHRSEVARADNRLFVVFLDDYHVRRENGMRVREQLSAFLSQLSAHDLVAIATPFSSVSGLTFSRSHAGLASHVLNFEGRKYDYTPKNAIEERYQNLPIEQQEQMRNSIVISALASVSEYLGTLREGRKSIVYVSEGMSGSLPSGVVVKSPMGFGARTQTGVTGNGRDSFTFFENSALLQEIQSKVFQAASRNNVSVYTLDPRGLTNFEYGVGENVSTADDRRIVQETSDLLRVIADETGGRAIVGRNDPLPVLRQMVDDSRTYYLLGYTSTEAPRDGRFHQIQVRVRRANVDVRARKGYWAYTAEEVARATAPPKPASPAEVTEALDQLASAATPGRGRAVSVWMGAVRGATEQARVTLAWEAAASQPSSPLDAVDRLAVVVTTLSGRDVFTGTVPRTSAVGRPGGVVGFDAPAGPLRVRLTAENARGIRLENEEMNLDVPDFTGTAPQITAPFLYRGRTARDLQQIRAAELPTPAVLPVFTRAERVLIRFGAYAPGGSVPKVSMRLLNQQGSSLAQLPAPVSTTTGSLESELGLGSFPPGDYLVEIVAEAAGETAKRVVGLRVVGG